MRPVCGCDRWQLAGRCRIKISVGYLRNEAGVRAMVAFRVLLFSLRAGRGVPVGLGVRQPVNKSLTRPAVPSKGFLVLMYGA